MTMSCAVRRAESQGERQSMCDQSAGSEVQFELLMEVNLAIASECYLTVECVLHCACPIMSDLVRHLVQPSKPSQRLLFHSGDEGYSLGYLARR